MQQRYIPHCLRFYLLLLLLPFLCIQQAQSAAWIDHTRDLTIYKTSLYQADSFNDNNGRSFSIPTYRKYGISVYKEKPLNKQWLFGSETAIALEENTGNPSSSIERKTLYLDETLFIRYLMKQLGDKVFSSQLTIDFPTIYHNSAITGSSGETLSAEARLLYGQSFQWKEKPCFLNIELGSRRYYQHHDGGNASLSLTAGLHWNEKYTFYSTLSTEQNKKAIWLASDRKIRYNYYDLYKIEGTLQYTLKKGRRIAVSLAKELDSRNTGVGHSIIFSFWRQKFHTT